MADDPDVAAFYEANYEQLLVQLFAVTANLADAEDVVQEGFARACVRWRRLHAYDAPPKDGLVTERHGGQGCGE
jgi:RNA polymerase sigma-70 factor (ECF subfamily)